VSKFSSHSIAFVAPNPRHACIAAALIALVAGATPAADSPPRDSAFESQQVYRFCRNFSTPTRRELASLQYLLSFDELADMLALRTEQSCRKWIDEFWRNRDPNLATPENEARVEHDRRVETATSSFSRGEWPGWDQRGEVCVRYGMPPARDVQPGDVTPDGYIRPAEYWFYPLHGMTVQFEDAFGNGNYTYFLEHVALPTYERPSSDRMRMPAGQWREMPDLDLDHMTLDVVLGIYGGYFGLPDYSAQFTYDDYLESLRHFPEVLETTPATYPFDFAFVRVPFDYEVAFFRGGEAVDRVDVNAEFEVDAQSLPVAMEARRYRATAVVFTPDGSEVARLSHNSTVPTVPAGTESLRNVLVQLPFTLAPNRYELAVTVEDTDTGRFSSYKRMIHPDDFDRNLAMSSVCFASGIEPVKKESAFNRGALEVVPRPSARYEVAASVPVYFEVYNVAADEEGRHRYTVSYRVIPQSPAPKGFLKKLVGKSDDPTSLASSFESAATGPHDVVYLFVRTDNLWPGEFELDISIRDVASKQEATRRSRFHIVE
jgi:GWxTD domain-containing protein